MKNTQIHNTIRISGILLAVFMFSIMLFSPRPALAQLYTGGCTYIGQCINGKSCISERGAVAPNGPDCGAAMVGSVEVPSSIRLYDMNTGQANGIGLVMFISRLLQFFAVIVGIFSLFNIISIGYTYLSGMGDPAAHTNMREKLTYTVFGLILIASAYAIAGAIGLLFFGDAGYILFPRFVSFSDL